MARKILLADDSVTAQNMGRRILSEAGYEVITVNNGSAALKKIAEQKPDLIILDVYMPGYGGVEVCQRVKESPDTARVPVLLTVGKLEPFKADEARRVHADAHLVKPFEASELLTLLTKLEDKIVPEPEPPTSRSGARTRIQRPATAAGDPQFGDATTGWKSRLHIPTTGLRAEGSEASQASPTGFRDFLRREENQPIDVPHAPSTPAGLHDITADEIAAIAAAAEAFSDTAALDSPESLAEAAAQDPVAGFSAAEVPSIPEPSLQLQDSEPAAASELAPVQDAGADDAATEVAARVEAPRYAQRDEFESQAQPEVASALTFEETETPVPIEAIAPANGDWSAYGELEAAEETAQPASQTSTLPEADEIAAAAPWERIGTVAEAAVDSLRVASSRWVAEPIPVPADERDLVLEQEMQKACAVMSSVEPSLAAVGEPSFESARFETYGDSSAVTESSTSQTESYAAEAEAAEPQLAPMNEVEMAGDPASEAELAVPDSAMAEASALPAQEFPADAESFERPTPPAMWEADPAAAQAGAENVAQPEKADVTSAEQAAQPETVAPEVVSEALVSQELVSQDQAAQPEASVCAENAAEQATPPEVVAEAAADADISSSTGSPDEMTAAAAAPVAEPEMVDAVGTAEVASANVEQLAAEPAEAQPVDSAAESAPSPETVVVEPRGEAAFAAAASAGLAFRNITHTVAGPSSDVAEERVAEEPPATGPATEPNEAASEMGSEREAELAAAWAHWKQIRESIANPQFTSQVADAAAAGLRDPQAGHAPPQAETNAAEADPSAIASIVDSVLAELKPKLVEEIAKKLGKDKK